MTHPDGAVRAALSAVAESVGGASSLAANLAPVLQSTLEGRLHDLRWFRADWQRGGAATARAEYDHPTMGRVEAVVKIPIGSAELTWTRRLQKDDDPGDGPVVPRLYGSGDELAGYDLAWLVMERLPVGPLGARWRDDTIPRMAIAAARFYAACSTWPVDICPMPEPWDELVRGARESVRENAVPARQRWQAALKTISMHLDRLDSIWRSRPVNDWIHGDLHPANALCRSDAADAPVVLIDLAEVRAGHWVEDAVYLERLLWTQPDRLKAHKPMREIRRARQSLGLPVGDDDVKFAAVRRVLLAATAPRFMRTEGSPAHLNACLERLEAAESEFRKFGI